MQLKIRSVHGHGDQNKEYVLIDVLASCNLTNYAVMDTTYTANDKISNKHRHFHWFAPRDVRHGDVIYLFSRTGTDEMKVDRQGKRYHYIYWGLRAPVWNDGGDAAVLFHLVNWETTRAK